MAIRSTNLARILIVALVAGFAFAGCGKKNKPWWDVWGSDESSEGIHPDDKILPPLPPPLDPAFGNGSGLLDLPAVADIPPGGLPPADPIRSQIPSAPSEGTLEPIFFAYDSSVLNAESIASLQRSVRWLLANSNLQVQLEGHCDERGTREYNFGLGERRAMSVREYLASRGVNPQNLITISYGEERPLALGSDDGAWSQNRRVQFLVYQ